MEPKKIPHGMLGSDYPAPAYRVPLTKTLGDLYRLAMLAGYHVITDSLEGRPRIRVFAPSGCKFKSNQCMFLVYQGVGQFFSPECETVMCTSLANDMMAGVVSLVPQEGV